MSIFNIFKKANGENDLQSVLSPKKKENFLSQFMPESEDKQRALARSLIMRWRKYDGRWSDLLIGLPIYSA
jgi:hypothetical protein